MRVISRKALREFSERHPDAEQRLDDWYRLMRHGAFETPTELKRMFPSASFLSNNVVVFNVGGNNYRVSVRMRYDRQIVYVRHVMTHPEYDERSKKKQL